MAPPLPAASLPSNTATSAQTAPWTLVEANNKRYARIKVLRTLCERLENQLDTTPEDDAAG